MKFREGLRYEIYKEQKRNRIVSFQRRSGKSYFTSPIQVKTAIHIIRFTPYISLTLGAFSLYSILAAYSAP